MPVISYGGLTIGEVQGSNPEIGGWIAQNIRPAEIFPAARLQWPGYLTGGPVFDQTAYPWDHVEIDRLYWPWGASRFAHAHVVVDDTTLAKIRFQAYANQKFAALPFVMGDGQYATAITTKLWMLPPRPLSTAAPGGSALWLLSLVDDRYFWWESSLQYTVNAGVTAWTDLYTSIGTALGVTITPDAIPAAYGTPTTDYAAAYRPAPIVLDAVAWSIGQRIVRALDGTVRAMNVSSALAIQTAQAALYAPRKRRGGVYSLLSSQPNDLSALVPSTVEVIYPAGASGTASGYWPDTATLASLNLAQFPQPQIGGAPWTKVLHRYEVALIAGGGVPSNKTTLDTLTNQVATDWLKWQLAQMEQWYVGIAPWIPDGLSDIEWRAVPGETFTHLKRGVFNPQEDLVFPPPSVGTGITTQTITNAVTITDNNTFNWIVNNTFQFSGPGPLIFNTIIAIGYTTITNPTTNTIINYGNSSKLRIVTSADIDIQGFTAGIPGEQLYLWNVGPGKVRLLHANATALAANASINTPLGQTIPNSHYTLWPGDGVIIEYDGVSLFWRFDPPTIAAGDATSTPITYAIRFLHFGAGLTYADLGNGEGLITVAPPATATEKIKEAWVMPSADEGATMIASGILAFPTAGTSSAVHNARGGWWNLASTGGGVEQLYVNVGAGTGCNHLDQQPLWRWHIEFASATDYDANSRFWCGMTDIGMTFTTLKAQDTLNGLNGLMFRASGVLGDTNWMVCYNDTGATMPAAINTGVALAASTKYVLQIDGTNPASVVFKINGTAVAIVTTRLPASSTRLAMLTMSAVVNAVVRNMRFGLFRVDYLN